jgi:hypothetical protein
MRGHFCPAQVQLLAWLAPVLLTACRLLPSTEPPAAAQPDPVLRHIGEDGTHFEVSVGDTRALPPHFPQQLRLPNATVVSSGQIWDQEGGLASLILETSQPLEEIAAYYRRTLWGRGWDLLSNVEQANGIRTLVFESPPPPRQTTPAGSHPAGIPSPRAGSGGVPRYLDFAEYHCPCWRSAACCSLEHARLYPSN